MHLRRSKKNGLLYTLLAFLFWLPLRSQEMESFLVIAIKTEQTKSIHKSHTDYWLLSVDSLEKGSEDYLVPLYVHGFSNQDVLECLDGELVFYNLKPSDSFPDYSVTDSLLKAFESRRWKYSTTKNYKKSKSVRIKVYAVEVRGEFIYCNFSSISLSSIGYVGSKIAIPIKIEISDRLNNLIDRVDRHDFFRLPYIGLQDTQ